MIWILAADAAGERLEGGLHFLQGGEKDLGVGEEAPVIELMQDSGLLIEVLCGVAGYVELVEQSPMTTGGVGWRLHITR